MRHGPPITLQTLANLRSNNDVFPQQLKWVNDPQAGEECISKYIPEEARADRFYERENLLLAMHVIRACGVDIPDFIIERQKAILKEYLSNFFPLEQADGLVNKVEEAHQIAASEIESIIPKLNSVTKRNLIEIIDYMHALSSHPYNTMLQGFSTLDFLEMPKFEHAETVATAPETALESYGTHTTHAVDKEGLLAVMGMYLDLELGILTNVLLGKLGIKGTERPVAGLGDNITHLNSMFSMEGMENLKTPGADIARIARDVSATEFPSPARKSL